jgi:3-hydroxybutyryl-CoA dehydrogenase
MRILLIGNNNQVAEFQQKFGDTHQYLVTNNGMIDEQSLLDQDLIVDFTIDESPENLEWYKDISGMPVLVNIPKTSLSELVYFSGGIECCLFGFNGLPTFVNREILEVSLYREDDKLTLQKLCDDLGTKHLAVADRVGMVTPRVIFMIINEAYFTVQEGTAQKEDIDQGMKLGTNYPFGPFEWSQRIGLQHVYELLEAVYEDTKDERYKICPLLKKEYLNLGMV